MMMLDHTRPLAVRMRPQTIDSFKGQRHLTAPGKPLYQVTQEGRLHSMILWGPPGTGKTTLATILATATNARVEQLSAVLSGVKDIREVVARAEAARDLQQQSTVLFVDEVHRFNKSQQDAFLPHVENGTIILIGATTENPSFELNNALLSRVRVYVLKRLTDDDLLEIVNEALQNKEVGLGNRPLIFSEDLKKQLIQFSDGDARQALNVLEICADFAKEQNGVEVVSDNVLKDVLGARVRHFDRGGDIFHDQISALHKSVRGSDPDASLYWLCRMFDGGCDPLYIARRIIRMASEDIGNADPRALEIALNAWEVYERLGSPEGELTLAQAIIYMACAPKSNAVYMAFNTAMDDVKKQGTLEVPFHLRNAPTNLMKSLDYHKGYRYPHDEPNAYAIGVHYFPENVDAKRYYEPVNRGLEIKIREKLEKFRELNRDQK